MVESTKLAVDVARFWTLRQMLGADPKVSKSKASEAIFAAMNLSTSKEDLDCMKAKPRKERRMSKRQMDVFIDKLRGEVGQKSSWTIGRKNPAIQLEYILSLEAFLQNDAVTTPDGEPMVNILDLRKVKGVGPWVQFSIMHHVLDLDYMVPRDSRVMRNALRCAPIKAALGENHKVEDVDDFLIRKFGDPGGDPCASKCKKRKGNCYKCLRMTPDLKLWYSTLNLEKVGVDTLDELWCKTVGEKFKRAKHKLA